MLRRTSNDGHIHSTSTIVVCFLCPVFSCDYIQNVSRGNIYLKLPKSTISALQSTYLAFPCVGFVCRFRYHFLLLLLILLSSFYFYIHFYCSSSSSFFFFPFPLLFLISNLYFSLYACLSRLAYLHPHLFSRYPPKASNRPPSQRQPPKDSDFMIQTSLKRSFCESFGLFLSRYRPPSSGRCSLITVARLSLENHCLLTNVNTSSRTVASNTFKGRGGKTNYNVGTRSEDSSRTAICI